MPKSRRALIVAAAITAAAGLSAAPSYAIGGNGSGGGGGGGNGGGNGGGDGGGTGGNPYENGSTIAIPLHSTTGTQYKAGAGNTGGSTATAAALCWYEPVGSPADFKSLLDSVNRAEHNDTTWPDFSSWHDGWVNQWAAHENDKGTFYQSICADPSAPDAIAWNKDNNHPQFVYVAPNTTPPGGNTTVTPQMIAVYILKSTILANPAPTFSPAATGTSYVNLATWAWQPWQQPQPGQSGFKVANLIGTLNGLTVTVVMTPASMTLSTDGPTTSGIPVTCHSTTDGVGVAWADGDSDPSAPGCGLKFTAPRASGGGYNVHADVDWKITWTSNQTNGVQTLPDVHMVTNTPITVKELQSIN